MQIFKGLIGLAVLLAATATIGASDRTGIYGRIDKVVLEPGPEAPEAIQIWGVFALAKPNDVNDYLPAAQGYLYFELSRNRELALKEWADFRSLAGSGGAVAFANRMQLRARVRKPSERPEHPDPYVVGFGLVKVRNTDYAPVQSVINFKN